MRRLLALFLLAWLPLQAAALPMLALHCESGHGGHALAAGAHHADEAGAEGHDHAPPDHDGSSDTGAGHQHYCCQHFSALPVTDLSVQSERAASLAAFDGFALFSFFPDPQRRPPRA
jgi:hypothetical protein